MALPKTTIAEGRLHRYSVERNLTFFEYLPLSSDFPESGHVKRNTLVSIGGLNDGYLNVPYISLLASYVNQSRDWRIVEVQLSSFGRSWGTADLHSDVEDMTQAVDYLRNSVHKSSGNPVPEDGGKIVLMGHSTGSQDVLHYLYHPSERPRPPVDGAILLAPVSDREGIAMMCEANKDMKKAYEECLQIATKARQDPDHNKTHTLPPLLTSRLCWPDLTISCERFLSMATCSSPERPELDDLFSSDLPDEVLKRTFGVVGTLGILKSKPHSNPSILILFSGEDEYMPKSVDKERLIERWGAAIRQGGATVAEGSGVVAGASHGVLERGPALDAARRVLRYLDQVGAELPEVILSKLDEDLKRLDLEGQQEPK